ncbi:hypothetical protein K443DRAFT_5689 [Laccaria amethystina LaAM-08-1]|uniref:Tyrosinase C-terminal domain-containing protein n=1 Tax=Laccaria amethystina LaAM-08-1 TaxID=1095629 RepID=A0A0C9XN72_9AGAR|nr:hypothetical protein K443DRAFT_5689 [Laccaria amethystina LaAM-08-1]
MGDTGTTGMMVVYAQTRSPVLLDSIPEFGSLRRLVKRVHLLPPLGFPSTRIHASAGIADTAKLEFNGLDMANPAGVRKAIADIVVGLYGDTVLGLLPTKAISTIAATAAGQFWDWTSHVKVKKFEIGTSFSILFFLGSVLENPKEYINSPNLVHTMSSSIALRNAARTAKSKKTLSRKASSTSISKDKPDRVLQERLSKSLETMHVDNVNERPRGVCESVSPSIILVLPKLLDIVIPRPGLNSQLPFAHVTKCKVHTCRPIPRSSPIQTFTSSGVQCDDNASFDKTAIDIATICRPLTPSSRNPSWDSQLNRARY